MLALEFWIKFKLSRVKVCVVGSIYRLCILEDLNVWIGDRKRAGITGAFGIPRENDNGRRVVEFCEEMGLCVSNTF